MERLDCFFQLNVLNIFRIPSCFDWIKMKMGRGDKRRNGWGLGGRGRGLQERELVVQLFWTNSSITSFISINISNSKIKTKNTTKKASYINIFVITNQSLHSEILQISPCASHKTPRKLANRYPWCSALAKHGLTAPWWPLWWENPPSDYYRMYVLTVLSFFHRLNDSQLQSILSIHGTLDLMLCKELLYCHNAES